MTEFDAEMNADCLSTARSVAIGMLLGALMIGLLNALLLWGIEVLS